MTTCIPCSDAYSNEPIGKGIHEQVLLHFTNYPLILILKKMRFGLFSNYRFLVLFWTSFLICIINYQNFIGNMLKYGFLNSTHIKCWNLFFGNFNGCKYHFWHIYSINLSEMLHKVNLKSFEKFKNVILKSCSIWNMRENTYFRYNCKCCHLENAVTGKPPWQIENKFVKYIIFISFFLFLFYEYNNI